MLSALPPDLEARLDAELPPEFSEKAKAIFMSALLDQSPQVSEQNEDPNIYYQWLRKTFELGLEDTPISISKAASKYKVGQATVLRWVSAKLVKVIAPSPQNGVAAKLNERDIAILAEMHKHFRSEGNKTGTIKGWRPKPLY